MPAQVVIVTDEAGFSDRVAAALGAHGHEVSTFTDSMAALEALEAAERVELLITSLDQKDGKPNGVSLARVTRTKRPGLKVLFLGQPALERVTAGLGTLIATPVSANAVVARAEEMLDSAA